MTSTHLKDAESLCYFLHALWSPEKRDDRLRLSIVDTIIFRDGCPIRWLFTSEKTGVRLSFHITLV